MVPKPLIARFIRSVTRLPLASGLLLWGASAASATPIYVDAEGPPALNDVMLQLEIDPARGQAPGPEGIWNGTVVTGNQYPNVVALAQINEHGSGAVFCSGSLITDRWVLTAAHCLTDLNDAVAAGYYPYVIFGNNVYTSTTDVVAVTSAYIYPDYDGENFLHDIGLMELSTPKHGVDFAVLNKQAMSSGWKGTPLTILGFGITSDNAGDTGIKRVTTAPIVDYDALYVYTYDPSTNVCQGDSGGPAFAQAGQGLHQVGVNAFVTPGCVGGSAGLTRVDTYLPWIQSIVPGVLTDGTGAGSGGSGGGGNGGGGDGGGGDGGGGGGGGGGPTLPGTDGSSDYDRAMGDPARPDSDTFHTGMRCDLTGGAPWLGAGWLVGLLVVARRRTR